MVGLLNKHLLQYEKLINGNNVLWTKYSWTNTAVRSWKW